MNFIRQTTLCIIVLFVSFGCSETAPEVDAVTQRWYTTDQVQQGQDLYLTHCASCHAEQAQGSAQWRTPGEDGVYPPPPLNGTAHTWHHPMEVLEGAIANGGARIGGVMPGFAGTLNATQTRAIIAYFQSHWSDDIYARWQDIDAR